MKSWSTDKQIEIRNKIVKQCKYPITEDSENNGWRLIVYNLRNEEKTNMEKLKIEICQDGTVIETLSDISEKKNGYHKLFKDITDEEIVKLCKRFNDFNS